MKKYMVLTVVLTVLCSMFACVPASAESGVVGHIYSTDILTYVNGQPIDGPYITAEILAGCTDANVQVLMG